MSEDFMVTEITIKRGRRVRDDDGNWSWIEEPIEKRGMVLQEADNINGDFLKGLQGAITNIMAKLFESWKDKQVPKKIVTDVSAAVVYAINNKEVH